MRRGFAFTAAFTLLTITVSGQSPKPESKPPKQVIEEYFRMEAQGERLTPEGWYKAGAFFVHPGPPPKNLQITVIDKNYAVWAQTIEPTTAYIIVDFLPQGQIDSTMHFIPSKFQKAGVRYRLVLTDTHREPGPAGSPPKEIKGLADWRIEGPVTPLWITVETAIRYVTQMRDKASDPVVKKSANQTLAKLKNLQ